MNTFQIVMLVMAGGLFLSVFWEQLKSLFANMEIKKPEIFKPSNDDTPSTLVEVVASWEHLKKGCEKHNLKKAVVALKAIFPLFVVEEEDEKNV